MLAAVTKRAAYLDSSGESTFIRDMRERVGQRAVDAGTSLIPAFGYDYVPGNLAGALALRRAGPDASRLDVGYFAPGMGGVSGGTVASSVGMMLMPSFRFDDGRLVDDRLGARTRTFRVGADAVVTVAVGGSEHLFLPALAPGLRAVGVYLGWFGTACPLRPAGGRRRTGRDGGPRGRIPAVVRGGQVPRVGRRSGRRRTSPRGSHWWSPRSATRTAAPSPAWS